jgi:hypothetical protein
MYEIVIMIILNIIMLCSHIVTSHIARVVVGPAQHEGVPPCHCPCWAGTTRRHATVPLARLGLSKEV